MTTLSSFANSSIASGVTTSTYFKRVQPNEIQTDSQQVENAPEQDDSFTFHYQISGVQDEKHPEAARAFNQSLLTEASKDALEWMPEPGEGGGTYETHAAPVYSDGNLTVIDVSYEAYIAGAAHPSNGIESHLYDRRTGQEAKLEDLFADKAHGKERLYGLIRSDLQEQGGEVADFAKYYISPKTENLNAFHPTKDGLAFMVPSERTGPIGAGVFESVIPWSSLKLDPKGPLQQPAA